MFVLSHGGQHRTLLLPIDTPAWTMVPLEPGQARAPAISGTVMSGVSVLRGKLSCETVRTSGCIQSGVSRVSFRTSDTA